MNHYDASASPTSKHYLTSIRLKTSTKPNVLLGISLISPNTKRLNPNMFCLSLKLARQGQGFFINMSRAC